MNAQGYHRQFIDLISRIPAIVNSNVEFREIDENECYLKATLTFASGHVLHIAEYVIIQGDNLRRTKYRYQLLDNSQKHVSRWDNVPHHKDIETFPNHHHNSGELIHASRVTSPVQAIAESLELIAKRKGDSNV